MSFAGAMLAPERAAVDAAELGATLAEATDDAAAKMRVIVIVAKFIVAILMGPQFKADVEKNRSAVMSVFPLAAALSLR